MTKKRTIKELIKIQKMSLYDDKNASQNKLNMDYCIHVSWQCILSMFLSKIYPEYQNIILCIFTIMCLLFLFLINKAKTGSKLIYSLGVLSMLIFILLISPNNFYIFFEGRKNSIHIKGL